MIDKYFLFFPITWRCSGGQYVVLEKWYSITILEIKLAMHQRGVFEHDYAIYFKFVLLLKTVRLSPGSFGRMLTNTHGKGQNWEADGGSVFDAF